MSAIAFEDYLTEERKQEIAETAFRDICEEKFRSDAERIFSNAAYKAVWNVVDEAFDGKTAQMVADKIPGIIEGLTEYNVFRAKGAYEREDSPGQIALRAAVERHKGTLGERVAYLAGEITKEDVVNLLLDSDISLKISHAE